MPAIYRVLIASLGWALVVPVYSAQWEAFGGTDTARVFIDKESIKRSGSVVKVWLKWVNDTPRPVFGSVDGALSTLELTLNAYNCVSRESAILQVIKYGGKGDGEVLMQASARDDPSRYEAVVPESLAEKVLSQVCVKSIHPKR